MTRTFIPEISVERLLELDARIRPLVMKDGVPYEISVPSSICNIAYTWNPKFIAPMTGLVPFRDITTYHRWAYYGYFKPTVEEVLACIPEDIVMEVEAFAIVDFPKTADDFKKDREAFDAGYHVATTRLYKRA